MSQQTGTTNYLNKTELSIFDELKTQLEETDSVVTDAGTAGLSNLSDLCKKYNQVKSTLELALKAVEKIPFIGQKVAKAIRFLMSVADFACPIEGVASIESVDMSAADSGSTMTLSLEQIAAFERLDSAISSSPGFSFDSADAVSAMSFNKDEVCTQYNKVRKFIKPVLPIIGLIPGVGGTIVVAINLLMGIADSICGGSNN